MQQLPDVIKVKLETRHFKEATCYRDNHNCPLAMYLKEMYPDIPLSVGVFTVNNGNYILDNHHFEIEYYIDKRWRDINDIWVDKKIASAKNGKEIKPIKFSLTKVL